MRISNKSISCDFCGIVFSDDFTYYSCDAREINVYAGNRQSIDNCLLEAIVRSNEICPSCYANLGKKIISINSKEIKPVRTLRNYDLCELTGQHLKGDYQYYYVVIDKVEVKSSNSYVCTKCKNSYTGKPTANCKCGNTSFINPSSVNVQHRQLEFRTTIKPYIDMIKPADKSNNWSTST